MGMFSESVDVACTPAGQPESLDWAGRHYVLCAEPVRWFERRQWWAEEQRAPLGSGPGLVDHEIWRVQVQLQTHGRDRVPDRARDAGNPEQTLTLDLSRHLGSGRWRLLRIHDAVAPFPRSESA
jgi:hypothetical protein